VADKQGVLRAYLDRVVAGDLQGAADFYTDGVVFHWAGHGPLSGDYRGKAAILEMFAKFSNLVEAKLEPHDVLFSDDHAVVLARGTYQRGGRSVSTNRIVVYHFAGDQISELWLVDERQQEMDGLLS